MAGVGVGRRRNFPERRKTAVQSKTWRGHSKQARWKPDKNFSAAEGGCGRGGEQGRGRSRQGLGPGGTLVRTVRAPFNCRRLPGTSLLQPEEACASWNHLGREPGPGPPLSRPLAVCRRERLWFPKSMCPHFFCIT